MVCWASRSARTIKRTRFNASMSLVKWSSLLAVFWLLLSGYFQPLMLSFGVLTILLTIWLIKRMRALDESPKHFGSTIGFVRYVPWVLSQILLSSTQVAKHIWSRSPKLNPVLDQIPVSAVPANKQVLYANSITLTPGTLCVDIDEQNVTVHALEKSSIDELKDGAIAHQIDKLWGQNK